MSASHGISSPLFEFPQVAIHVSSMLTGGKKGILKGGKDAYVSPAMMELIKGATTEGELRRVLEVIEWIEFPGNVGFYSLPMTTKPQ